MDECERYWVFKRIDIARRRRFHFSVWMKCLLSDVPRFPTDLDAMKIGMDFTGCVAHLKICGVIPSRRPGQLLQARVNVYILTIMYKN